VFGLALAQLAVAGILAWVVWGMRSRRPGVFLLFPLLGFAWGWALHGLCFFADGSPQPGMLMGFGFLVGLFVGLPLGIVAGLVGWWLDRLGWLPPGD
jgi:hypothetical protein